MTNAIMDYVAYPYIRTAYPYIGPASGLLSSRVVGSNPALGKNDFSRDPKFLYVYG